MADRPPAVPSLHANLAEQLAALAPPPAPPANVVIHLAAGATLNLVLPAPPPAPASKTE
jgi:hypothetical protein